MGPTPVQPQCAEASAGSIVDGLMRATPLIISGVVTRQQGMPGLSLGPATPWWAADQGVAI